MKDAGYTLVETLAALTILALAVGGLAAGTQVMARGQLGLENELRDLRARRDAQLRLNDLLSGQGSFGAHQPERFAGEARRFAFACGEPQPCAAELVDRTDGVALRIAAHGAATIYPLRAAGPARFAYRGALGASEVWPPARPERQALRGVALMGLEANGERPWLEARIWPEQPLDCAFDVILQDCR